MATLNRPVAASQCFATARPAAGTRRIACRASSSNVDILRSAGVAAASTLLSLSLLAGGKASVTSFRRANCTRKRRCNISRCSPYTSGASARPEGVNRPELLPPNGNETPVIDVAGFLTPSEVRRATARVRCTVHASIHTPRPMPCHSATLWQGIRGMMRL